MIGKIHLSTLCYLPESIPQDALTKDGTSQMWGCPRLGTSLMYVSHFSVTRVRAMKSILRKIIEPQLLDFEEFTTVLVDAKAVLNRKPLIHMIDATPTNRVTAFTWLFLVGTLLKAFPVFVDQEMNILLLEHWNLVHRLSSDIWHHWKNSYLQTLHQARGQVEQL